MDPDVGLVRDWQVQAVVIIDHWPCATLLVGPCHGFRMVSDGTVRGCCVGSPLRRVCDSQDNDTRRVTQVSKVPWG